MQRLASVVSHWFRVPRHRRSLLDAQSARNGGYTLPLPEIILTTIDLNREAIGVKQGNKFLGSGLGGGESIRSTKQTN